MTVLLLILLILGLIIKTRDFVDGKMLIRDWIYLRWLNTQSLSNLDDQAMQTRQSDIIVCLTTIPSRIALLEPTLKSVLHQSRAPQEIRIHLPVHSTREQCAYTIPAFLHQNLNRVHIIPGQSH